MSWKDLNNFEMTEDYNNTCTYNEKTHAKEGMKAY